MSGTSDFISPSTLADTGMTAECPVVSIVVPAYNEEKRLGSTLKRMLAYMDGRGVSYEIVVVDDGSEDRTVEVVQHIAACRPQVRLLTYAANRGKGYAVRYGMLRAQGERILFSDADLATPIEEIEKLLAQLEAGCDVVIGSRDMPGSELVKQQSFLRENGGKICNRMIRMIAVPGIHDTQCGFKLFTRGASQAIFSQSQIDHFAFDVEVLYLAQRMFGFRLAEVPVRWAHQEGSKVRVVRDAWRMLKTLLRIRFMHRVPAVAPARLNLQ